MADLAIGISKAAVEALVSKVQSAIKEEAEKWLTVQRDLVTSGPFELSTGCPGHAMAPPDDIRPRQQTRPVFGATMNNQSSALRNFIISPVKRPEVSRNRQHILTL